MMRALALALGAALWSCSLAAHAAAPAPVRATLPNGLSVVASAGSGSDVAACLTLPVGSSAERPTEAGAARALARAVAPGEFAVGVDQTRWCTSGAGGLPDVLARLAATFTAPPPAMAPEAPDAELAARLKLRSLAYQGSWAVDHDALQPRSDPALLARFRQRTYTIRGARLGIAGALPADWLALVRRHFGKPTPAALPPAPAAAPRQTSPRYMRFEHPGATAHVLYFGWALGAAGTPEHRAARWIAEALGGGEAATLRTLFVKRRGMLRSLEVRVERGGAGNLFTIRLELKSNVAAASVEKLLAQVLGRLRSNGLTAAELERTRTELERRQPAALPEPLALAEELGSLDFVDTLQAPSAAEIRRAAALFGHDRQNLVELLPPGYVPVPPTPKSQVHVVKRGDTLSGIARRYGVSVDHLRRKNGLRRGATLQIGQRLLFDTRRR